MKQFFLFIAFFSLSLISYSQRTAKVSATFTYYAPETMSIEEAKRESLKRAQIDAIANEFGTLIGQHNMSKIHNENGNSHMDFQSLRWSDVKGEWLETIVPPKYDIQFDGHLLIVKCEVTGTVKEINRPTLDIVTKPLKNGTDLRYEAYDFRDGDDLFLYFSSPIDGYISVYLLDDIHQIVYNILPYKSQNTSSTKIFANKEYVFFSKNHVETKEKKEVDEYTLTTDSEREFQTLYILFSQNEISKKRGFESNEVSLPKHIPYVNFQSWLSKTLSEDRHLQLFQFPLTINK